MEIISYLPYLRTLTEEAEHRLISSLDRTQRGYDVDLVTPLIHRDEDPDLAREDISKSFLPKVTSEFEWLNQAELEQSEKIGSYSIMLPYSERREQVYSYYAHKSTNVDEAAFAEAVVRLKARLPVSRLHSVPLLTAFEKMPAGTNQGAPFFSKDSEFRIASLWTAERIQRRNWQWDVDPCLLYWRGQPRGLHSAPKQRTVWGYPHYMIIIGLSIQIPLLNALKQEDTFVAWTNQDNIDVVVTRMLEESRHEILSIDFSGFDASLSPRLIHAVFDVLREIFVSSEGRKLDLLENTMLEIPLLTPEGILIGTHGMPSGDALTNLIDGLVQILALEYAAVRCDIHIKDHIVQGDDGVISFWENWDIDSVVTAVDELGLAISSDKSNVSRDRVTFLQNWHSIDYSVRGLYRHVRPLMRILNGMLSYERLSKHWNGFDDTIRWWQQAESGKFHPKFESLVEFLYSHDRYSRTLSADQVLARAGGMESVKAVLKQDSFPFGKESLDGLTNFMIVRGLNQLRARGHLR